MPLTAGAGEGFYLGAESGVNFVNPQDYKIYGYGGIFGVPDGYPLSNVKFGTGWMFGLTTGYGFHNGLRPELELDYRRNQFSRLYRYPVGFFRGSNTDNVGGFENADSAMANLWYDFFKSRYIHPYIGGGIGEARIAVRHGRYDSTQLNNDYDTVFAYQGGAGVGFDLGRHWTASLDYRHLEGSASKDSLIQNQPSTHVEFNYHANSVMFGLRYSFGDDHAPAAPPPEAP
ncbi:MAG: outer membrane beta-barrel protein, partial [Nevskia sp.]|nr:outer membrane beta-barrel protein [Nevskia sp.]